MKTAILISTVLLLLPVTISAQLFSTSSTLRKGYYSVGIEPGVYASDEIDPNLFFHGGAGISNGVDLSVKLGVAGNQVYLGGDIKFAMGEYFSLAAGAHSYGNFGLDAMGIFTIPIKKKANFYTGADVDLIFTGNEVLIPLWVPLGVEIPLQKHILFLFETEVSLTGHAHFIGGGLNFLF